MPSSEDVTGYFAAACALRSDIPAVRRPAITTLLELARHSHGAIRHSAERALIEEFGPSRWTRGCRLARRQSKWSRSAMVTAGHVRGCGSIRNRCRSTPRPLSRPSRVWCRASCRPHPRAHGRAFKPPLLLIFPSPASPSQSHPPRTALQPLHQPLLLACRTISRQSLSVASARGLARKPLHGPGRMTP